ncbi:MAG: carboxylesterase family protein [Erysipelotrichaceae bacterium]|nr:carboxylesterase family protein [Erysipelotrichaceae bacterium]
MEKTALETSIGTFIGNMYEEAREFLGIPYARAGRFEYGERIDRYEDVFDATKMGNACPQYRQYYQNLRSPERLFYYREFREGIEFRYDEDCLNLNIYTPKSASGCPVILFFHGGGFNSGSNAEEPFRAFELAKRGIVTVFANYRVGVLGYFCHEEIEKKYHRNGNFGLDDQLQAIRWVRDHIREFGGDDQNITIMGQSAGAISVQYHCLNHDNAGLFSRAFMMSGGGCFPGFALPKKASETYGYWLELMDIAGCRNFEELRDADIRVIHDAYEAIRKRRKDNVYNTMPVIDGYLLKDGVDKLIRDPLKVDYMIGYTNSDMYAPMMAYIGNRFARDNGAYVYFFDIDQPGDENGAFHSSDLRYVFGRLGSSWRPFRDRDYEISGQMMDLLANFAEKGDPNGNGLPVWDKTDRHQSKVLCIRLKDVRMGRPSYFKMVRNMLQKGEPKA